ncbi:unnamed protein product [Danaus chrysippus]|uniref:(African queen) hypothetical protein n=1 Tax=Danaus chrysippus TaxID=151541 RepID=A0A8J2MWN8_9NEOP|nr:unnamed protein product [Danaus chrysippus]
MASSNPNNQVVGAMNVENDGAEPVQPRQPKNLQGLLRFAMEATKAEDAPGNSELGPMDEERRKFLEEALKSLTIDVAEVLQKSIKILSDSERIQSIQLGQELPEDVDIAFSNILELVDNIDTANDFYKLGGFSILPICLGCENDKIRSRASSILAELCQNNPFCQSRALECGLFNVMLHLAPSEKGMALAKCISAISSMVRDFKPSLQELTAQGGCELLANTLQGPDISARTRAAFLIRYLCNSYVDAKDKFVQQNIVKIIADLLKEGRDDTSEHLLSILDTLVQDVDPKVIKLCRDPGLNLDNILKEHLKNPELDECFIEERDYCRSILRVLENFPQFEQLNSEVDR